MYSWDVWVHHRSIIPWVDPPGAPPARPCHERGLCLRASLLEITLEVEHDLHLQDFVSNVQLETDAFSTSRSLSGGGPKGFLAFKDQN